MPLTIHSRLTPINHSQGRDGHRVRAICEHITDGDTAASAPSQPQVWLTSGNTLPPSPSGLAVMITVNSGEGGSP